MTNITNTTFALTSSTAVNEYVVEFTQFANKTAQAIIGMGRVVHRAKSTLGKDFDVFCAAIRFNKDSSAIRKLYQIGKMADFLDKYADRLPNTWTTVYRLTQLGDSMLEDAIEAGVVHASMSGLEAGRLVHKMLDTQPRSKKSTLASVASTPLQAANDGVYAFTIQFDGCPNPAEVATIESVLKDVATNSGNCSVLRSNPLEVLMQVEIQTSAA